MAEMICMLNKYQKWSHLYLCASFVYTIHITWPKKTNLLILGVYH